MSRDTYQNTKNDYQYILDFQKFNGSFVSVPDKFMKILKKIPDMVSSLGISKDEQKIVWATLICIALLRKTHSNSKSDWQMLEQKALKFLKNQGLATIKESISEALKLI